MHLGWGNTFPSSRALRTLLFCTSALAAVLPATASTGQEAAEIFAPRGRMASTMTFEIAPGRLSDALTLWAKTSGLKILAPTDKIKNVQTAGATGRLTAADALHQLLSGTELDYRMTNERHVTIFDPKAVLDAHAQAGTLPTVEVQAANNLETTEGSNSYVSNRASITKDGATIKQTPQSISVVTRKRIEDQNLTTLDKAAANATGIVVQQGDSDRPYYYSRGFPINTFQLDGVPTSIAISASAQDLAMYDRVEVLRGPAGLYNGFGSPGGTFNLVRKKPLYDFHVSDTISAGSYGYGRNEFDITGPLNEAKTVRGRFVGTLQSQDFIEDRAYRRLGQFYGIIEGDLSDSTTARVGAYYQQTPARQPWSGVPATKQYAFADVPRSTFVGVPWNKNIYTQTGAFTELEHKFDNGWMTKASLNYVRYQSDVTSSNFLGQIDPTSLVGTLALTHWKQDDQQIGFDWFASGSVDAFGREHKLTFGVNATHDDLGQQNFYGPGGSFYLQSRNIFDLNIPQPAFDGPVFDRHTYTNQYSAYGNARIKLADPLTLVVGGRLLWWDSKFDPVLNPSFPTQKPSHDGVDAKPIPYAGLVYDLNSTYALYGSYSQIYQPQTQRDAGGNLLKPVEGAQYEAGIKASYFEDRVIATFAFYSLTQQNRALQDTSSPTPTVYFAQGKARAQGVEAEISGRVTDRWNLFAGYTFTDTRNYDKSTNIGGVAFTTIAPKHLFKLWTTYNLPFDDDRWTIGGGVYASSKFYTQDVGGQLVAPGYGTLSASIAYKINEHYTASLMVDNIFDKTYIRSLTGTTNGFYGDPRTFLAKVQAKW